MSSPSLEDAFYRVDILEKVLSEEMAFFKSLKDPLKACLVHIFKGEDIGCLIDERDIYTKILNLTTIFMDKIRRAFAWMLGPPRMTKRVPLK